MSDTTECRMVTGGEIADELSDAFPDIPTSKARDAFRTILHAMQNALIRGDRIEIRGFGSFAPRYRQGRHAPQSALGREGLRPRTLGRDLQGRQGPARGDRRAHGTKGLIAS